MELLCSIAGAGKLVVGKTYSSKQQQQQQQQQHLTGLWKLIKFMTAFSMFY
jgi:hypothetical protein